MKTLSKFRKRNIQTNIAHFLLVIFVVAISVCLVVGLFINHITLKGAVEKFYANSELPNLWIETDRVTAADENYFKKYDYGKRLVFNTQFVMGKVNQETKVIIADGEISMPYLVEGDSGNGCFVDARFVKKHKIGINHSVIYINYTHLGQTKALGFKVLGSFSMAEDLVVDEECSIFIDEDAFVESLRLAFDDVTIDLSAINYNQILIASDITEQDKQDIRTYYQTSESELLSLRDRDEIESFIVVDDEIQVSKLMLWTFPLLFVAVAILVVVSAISDLVANERYNIGLLKSLGVKNREIISNYCGYGMFMCVIGAVIGAFLSPLIVPNITFETYDVILNLPHDEVKLLFPFKLVLLAVLISAVIGYLSAFFVCLNLNFKTPKECMIGSKKTKLKPRKKRKNRFGKLGSAIKNMKINRIRSTMSMVGIAGCSLLGIIGFGLSLDDGLTKTNRFLSFETFLNVFKLFSIVILILTIFILAMQIFKERAREMAMLRINGENYLNIWLSLILEMVVIGMIGFVLAAILSYPLLMIMLELFGVSGGVFINFMGFLKTFLINFAIIFIVSGIMLIKVCKLNLVDATKFSE